LISAARFDEAASHCADNASCLGRARLGQGRIDDAIQILVSNKRPLTPGYLGYAYGWAGRRREAENLLALTKMLANSENVRYQPYTDAIGPVPAVCE
jgi:hypothetical protein